MSVILPSSTKAVTPSQKTKMSQVQFALSEATLAVANHLMAFHEPWHSFHKDLARHTGETDQAVVLQFFLCSFLKMGYHNLSNTMNCDLATSSDSFLRTCECIPLSSVDLCTFTFLGWSQTWIFPTAGGSSFSQPLPLSSVTCMVWLEHLPVQTKAKKNTKYLNIFHDLGSHIFLLLQERTIHLSVF